MGVWKPGEGTTRRTFLRMPSFVGANAIVSTEIASGTQRFHRALDTRASTMFNRPHIARPRLVAPTKFETKMTNKSTDVPAPGSQSGSSTGSPRSGNSCGSATPSTFVLVHGAWHGGWCWRGVTDILRTPGHVVHAPSLTGLADRSHLLSPSIRLHDHVVDIVNLVKWEDLHDFVLVGHSYGGMVVSGVAPVTQDTRTPLG